MAQTSKYDVKIQLFDVKQAVSEYITDETELQLNGETYTDKAKFLEAAEKLSNLASVHRAQWKAIFHPGRLTTYEYYYVDTNVI